MSAVVLDDELSIVSNPSVHVTYPNNSSRRRHGSVQKAVKSSPPCL